MTIETLTYLLLGTGAAASGVFVLDYLRTADLKLPYARQTIALNAAIAGVLLLSILRKAGVVTSMKSIYLQMALFAIVDVALIAQQVLLRRLRKEMSRYQNGSDDASS